MEFSSKRRGRRTPDGGDAVAKRQCTLVEGGAASPADVEMPQAGGGLLSQLEAGIEEAAVTIPHSTRASRKRQVSQRPPELSQVQKDIRKTREVEQRRPLR